MRASKILIVGGGGREHALAWRCRHEGHEVFALPGNDGIAADAEILAGSVADHDGVVAAARRVGADLAIVGPEQPLVDGLADRLRAVDIATFGPSAAAAELEGSKAAAKAFMERHRIPTARHHTVTTLDDGLAALRSFATPPVVKADGLAAGKGVTVAESFEHAEAAVRGCLSDGAFGAAGTTVVLEERLRGQEASFFVLTDGIHAATLAAAQDHKRIGDGDTGPNTGGMGAYAPAPVFDDNVRRRTMTEIVEPTLAGLRSENRPFVGVLFIGLMIDERGQPSVVEYNCRFGDPEVQPLMFGLLDDVVPSLLAAASGRLEPHTFASRAAATVVLASAGYPASSRKGDPIEGLGAASRHDDVHLFHAGTRRSGSDSWVTNGGRVLGVCARADSLRDAIERAYRAAAEIRIPGGQMRRDIGARAL